MNGLQNFNLIFTKIPEHYIVNPLIEGVQSLILHCLTKVFKFWKNVFEHEDAILMK